MAHDSGASGPNSALQSAQAKAASAAPTKGPGGVDANINITSAAALGHLKPPSVGGMKLSPLGIGK